MKVLVCGNDSETAAVAEAAVYDAGCMPVGPVSNALRALGLADQECPAAALIDLSAVDDGNGLWLAEKLAERGIDIVCISDRRAGSHGLAIRRHVSVCKPTDREALIDCLESLRCDGAARRRPAAGDSSSVSAF